MAVLKSAYEQKKWQSIRNTASQPLDKVLRGNYTRKDIEALGKALKQYDDLASSIFEEGLRTAKERAQKATEELSKELTEATATNLAKLYSQELDRAYKDLLPAVAKTVQDVLSMSSQPSPEFAPNAQHKFNNKGQAANDIFEGSTLQKSVRMVNTKLDEQAKVMNTMRNMLDYGEAANDNASPSAPPSDVKPKVAVRDRSQRSQGWLHQLATYMDEREKRQERINKVKERRKQRYVLGMNRDKGFGKFLNQAQNTKKEAGKITAMLKDKYSKLGRFIPSRDNLGKMLMAAFLIPTVLKSAVTSFMDSFDVGHFAKQTFDSTIGWLWEKIKSFLGLDKKEEPYPEKGIKDRVQNNNVQSDKKKYEAQPFYMTQKAAEYRRRQGINVDDKYVVADQKTADELNKGTGSAPKPSVVTTDVPAPVTSSGGLTANTPMAVGNTPGQASITAPKVMGSVGGSGTTPMPTTAKAPVPPSGTDMPSVIANKPAAPPPTATPGFVSQQQSTPTGNRPLGLASIPTMSGIKDDLALMNLDLLTK